MGRWWWVEFACRRFRDLVVCQWVAVANQHAGNRNKQEGCCLRAYMCDSDYAVRPLAHLRPEAYSMHLSNTHRVLRMHLSVGWGGGQLLHFLCRALVLYRER